ncbi:antitoxin VbhA family protein [Neisseriaceae bacterium ESL0693]|nr:antitoxin VbhA family protein [Neisseriaceae bacterium ESL0693]
MITKAEQLSRESNVKEALAIVRLEGQNPGSRVLAVYDDYIAGKFDFEMCTEKVFEAALEDLRELSEQQDKDFPTA